MSRRVQGFYRYCRGIAKVADTATIALPGCAGSRGYASGDIRATMAKKTLGDLYGDHLREVMARADGALAAGGYDGLIVGSGSQRYFYLDDSTYPFRPNPRYRAWLPDASPDCYVVYRPGNRPKLVFHQPDDYWYLPPAAAGGLLGRLVRAGGRKVPLGTAPRGRRWRPLGRAWRTGRLRRRAWVTTTRRPWRWMLDYARAVKTPYEIECMALATVAGVRAHRAAKAAFRAGASEYEIHLAYCRAAGAREEELPYNNIIAFDTPCRRPALSGPGPTAAGGRALVPDRRRCPACGLRLRHHAHLRRRPGQIPGPDPVRRRRPEEARRPGPARVSTTGKSSSRHTAPLPGSWWRTASCRARPKPPSRPGLSSVFFPHGIGHLLGLMVHDAAGFTAGPRAARARSRKDIPYLRLTRDLEPGFVVTIEPGIYFIDSLLAQARADARGRAIDWKRVEALRPCGGIRIEDNVLAQPGAPRNLTREAFVAGD